MQSFVDFLSVPSIWKTSKADVKFGALAEKQLKDGLQKFEFRALPVI